jgi:hypothetical protein
MKYIMFLTKQVSFIKSAEEPTGCATRCKQASSIKRKEISNEKVTKLFSQKEVSVSMIPNPCIEVHTSPVDRPSVPAWFAEVVIIAHHLAANGLLDAFAHRVRLVRGRFGSYEPIDFLALLIGYAISGERTLADFFERLEPFEAAFMALFGRRCLPHRSSLSRFLADVDRPCLEAFRTLFQQQSFAEGWTTETIGGIFDRQGRRFIVFDVDATRQAARQRALPTAPELPPPRRRLDAVCAPGYTGRKRGEVVRTRTTALQMHTRQWIGTYAGKGNGDYREELASALQAITAYVKQFAFSSETALARLDGQYGDAAVVAETHACPYSCRDARQRLSTLGASPAPTRAGASTNSERDQAQYG